MRASLSVSAVAAVLLCFALTIQAQSSDSASGEKGTGSIYITHVTVIDTETGKESRDQTAVISGDRISEVKDSKEVKPAAGAKVVDGTGKYLIPGLWDMHVHTWDYESTYPLYIANGVTGVRDMFGPPDANKFRSELATKTIIAPHFYLASPIVDGHPAVWPQSIEVTTADQAKRVVDEQKQKGADFIKVYSRLSREAYFGILAESARVGIPVEGHVPLQVTAWDASKGKQKSFEHLNGIALACSTQEQKLLSNILPTSTLKERAAINAEAARSYSESKCNDLFTQLKTNGNWQVPTLTVLRSFGLLNDPEFLQDQRLRYFGGDYRKWLTAKDDFRLKGWTADDFALEREQFRFSKMLVGAMFRSGVPLLTGTDTGNPYCFPGFSLHDELALLVESGLTPLAALQAATVNAATFMNTSDRYGTIAPGKIADLVLLDADPLQDIHNTTKIAEVLLAGSEFNRHDLDAILRTAAAVAKTSAEPSSSAPQPVAEMQSLEKALAGTWSITEKFEPNEWTPNGGVGYGEEVWRRGPGGFKFMEEIHNHTPFEEGFGAGFSWWDSTKGLQGLWCTNTNPQGCDFQYALSGFGPKWDGKQLVVDMEFSRNGKKLAWHEVFSDNTQTSFVPTADIGEKGGLLKHWLTIHATRVADSAASSQQAFRGFWRLNAEKSDFGDRPKPKTGFVNWGENGWTFAIVQADGRVYADAVETSHGYMFIGMAPNDLSCEVEVVTPRHVRLTVKQGATVRRIGDIELLDDSTTQTTHHVTTSQGAPYVEKTIWEKCPLTKENAIHSQLRRRIFVPRALSLLPLLLRDSSGVRRFRVTESDEPRRWLGKRLRWSSMAC